MQEREDRRCRRERIDGSGERIDGAGERKDRRCTREGRMCRSERIVGVRQRERIDSLVERENIRWRRERG